jgi:hypothetical protein
MQQTFSAIAPKDIIAEFVKVQDQKPSARADALWDALGEDTIKGDGGRRDLSRPALG